MQVMLSYVQENLSWLFLMLWPICFFFNYSFPLFLNCTGFNKERYFVFQIQLYSTMRTGTQSHHVIKMTLYVYLKGHRKKAFICELVLKFTK